MKCNFEDIYRYETCLEQQNRHELFQTQLSSTTGNDFNELCHDEEILKYYIRY